MRYCLVSAHHWKDETEKPSNQLIISGLYQWGQAFGGGDYLYLPDLHKDQIEAYDIIHVNMTINNQTIITELRDKIGYPSSIKIVVNVDVSPDMWQNAYGRLPLILLREIDKADLIFHVEPVGANILSSVLSRSVPTLPHPVHVEALRDKYFSLARNGHFGVVYHRYDGHGNWLMPYLAVRDLELRRILFGWVGDVGDAPLLLYNDVMDRIEFDQLMSVLGQMSVCCDPFTYYAYGRFPIECAALGIPCITSDRVAAGKILFPELTVNPYDVRNIRALTIRLFSDIDFYEETASFAFHNAEYYNLEHSKQRLLNALDTSTSSPLLLKTRLSSPTPPWKFDTALQESIRDSQSDGTSLSELQSQEIIANDQAMSWCLAHGYQSCYKLNGQVFLPPLSDLSELLVTRIQTLQLPTNAPIIEVGCFQAILLLHLARSGFTNLTGIDASSIALDRAQSNIKRIKPHLTPETSLILHQADAHNLSIIPDASSMLTLAIEVLEHCLDPAAALAEIVRITAPGGRILISVPDRNQIPSPYHLNYFYCSGDEEFPFALESRRIDLQEFFAQVHCCSFTVEAFGSYLICALVKVERSSHGNQLNDTISPELTATGRPGRHRIRDLVPG